MISFWKRNMTNIETIPKRDMIGNGKSSKRKTVQLKSVKLWYLRNESMSSFQAISEKEKTTTKENELHELSELKSVAEKPNSSLVPKSDVTLILLTMK